MSMSDREYHSYDDDAQFHIHCGLTYIWAPLLIFPLKIISSPTCTDFGNAAINGINVIFFFFIFCFTFTGRYNLRFQGNEWWLSLFLYVIDSVKNYMLNTFHLPTNKIWPQIHFLHISIYFFSANFLRSQNSRNSIV